MATLATDTLTDQSSYSSGPIDVSTYHELWISATASAVAYTGNARIVASRIDAHGELYLIAQSALDVGQNSLDVGPGVSMQSPNIVSLGDTVQVDIICDPETTVSTTISVIGK